MIIRYRSNFFALFLALNTLIILSLLGFRAEGPDILNYANFTTDTSVLVRIPFAFIMSLLPGFFTPFNLSTLYCAMLHFVLKPRCKDDIIIIMVYLSGLVLLSYSANSLLGNLLRQALATILILFLMSMKLRGQLIFSGLATLVHISAIPVTFFLNSIVKSYKPKIIVALTILLVCVLVFMFYMIPDRFIVVWSRDKGDDILGYAFVALIFNLRLLFLLRLGNLSFKKYLVVSCGLLIFSVFGEFGQRILISTIFVLDIILINIYYRSKLFFNFMFFIWVFEAYFRYFITGNLWGIL